MSASSRPRPAEPAWTAAQWRAMRSPARVHLLAALEALGEASVTEVAELTGRTRQSIYPHLAGMARAGIIAAGTRTGRGRAVAVFRFLPGVLAASVSQATGRGLREAADVSAGALGDAAIRCRRWGRVADRQRIDLSRNPEAVTSIRVTWLDEPRRARLNRLLRQVHGVLRDGCERRTGLRTCVLLYHFPDLTAGEARAALAGSHPAGRRRRAAR